MSAIKQSAADWCFYKNISDPDAYYSKLKEIGFGAVEMAAPEYWDSVRNAGLEMLNIAGPGMREGLNNPENHQQLIPEITRLIDQASENRIPHVIILSGNNGDISVDDGFSTCVQAVRELAKKAEDSGVVLTFEMLNHFNHEDYQADHSAYGFRLVEEIDSPAVQVLYDIYHMHRMGEDVLKDVLDHLDRTVHIHVAGSPDRNFPGSDQEIDYSALVREISAAGYSGYWGHEWMEANAFPDRLEQAYNVFAGYC